MDPQPAFAIYILSGGVGASAEQVVHTLLAQFPDVKVPVVVTGNLREPEQIESVVREAQSKAGLIVHTLVDPELHRFTVELCERLGAAAFDLTGPLLEVLSERLGMPPLGRPGLYRRLRRDYFERITAIEYTLAHDDGKDPGGWGAADLVIAGVSRTGKTPICVYLSVLGWKAANVPIVPGVEPPPELFQRDPLTVFGLTIEAGQLIHQRMQRQRRMGATGYSPYVDPPQVYEEIEAARQMFKAAGFRVIDVTDKPVESTAEELIRLLGRPTRKSTL